MLYLCFLEAPKTETSFEGTPVRKTYPFSLEETGLTFEQADALCSELSEHKTIAAWVTGTPVEKIEEGSE